MYVYQRPTHYTTRNPALSHKGGTVFEYNNRTNAKRNYSVTFYAIMTKYGALVHLCLSENSDFHNYCVGGISASIPLSCAYV